MIQCYIFAWTAFESKREKKMSLKAGMVEFLDKHITHVKF